MRTFVLGDSHGGYRAFLQVMERSGFDYENDRLICLGDVSDGFYEVPELIEELLKIKNLVWVRGNHDQWLKDFLKYGKQPDIWTLQGGEVAKNAYLFRHPELREKHLKVLEKTPFYYIDEKNRLYVHGGFKPGVPMEEQGKMYLMWDRDLWYNRYNFEEQAEVTKDFSMVYVGHTSIYNFSKNPRRYGNVWFMDTGGGWEGVLSLMNVDTEEVFQSDRVKDLYADSPYKLRKKKK